MLVPVSTGINLTRLLCEVLEVIHPGGRNSDSYEREQRPFWHTLQSLGTFNALYGHAFKVSSAQAPT